MSAAPAPAFIIAAHKRPDLLARLVSALGDAPVSIHVDARSGVFPDVAAFASARPNVALLPRHACRWGLFGIVRASLEGLRWFLGTEADYALMITGQCYPIKPLGWLQAKLRSLEGRSAIEFSAFPKAEWSGHDAGGYRRIDRFYFKSPDRLRPRTLKLWTRRPPYGLHPYGGSAYWCLSRAAARYVMDYIGSHPKVLTFFKTTFVPDELIFQTILGNSPLADMLENELIHYTDWSHGAASPKTLTSADLPALARSDAWFARKFDTLADLDAVDRLREAT